MTDDPKQLIELMDALMIQIMLVRERMRNDKNLLDGLLARYNELEERWHVAIRKLADDS